MRSRYDQPFGSKFVSALLLFLALWPASAHGQIGIESLLANVTDISLSFSCWNENSASLEKRGGCPSERNGYGIEVLWGVKTIPLFGRTTSDSTWEVTGREASVRRGATDSTISLTYVPKRTQNLPPWSIAMELGLGYSQFSGFGAANPDYDLRGTIREVPSISLYGTLNHRNAEDEVFPLQPYVGIRTGLIQLHNVQLYAPVNADTAVVYSANGQAFQLGAMLGISWEMEPVHLFVEGAYHLRNLPSIQWTGSTLVPADLPRSFNFTGGSLSVGVQVHVRDPK
jgi:hypothetical protein